MTTVNPLDQKVADLAAARQRLETLEQPLKKAREAFEEAHAQEIAAIADAKREVEAVDLELRAAALAGFAQNGDKQPHAAVEIKEFDFCKYDPDTAKKWALENMHVLLVLNSAAYEKLLREVTKSTVLSSIISMPGTVSKKPQAQISPKKLVEFVPQAAPAAAEQEVTS